MAGQPGDPDYVPPPMPLAGLISASNPFARPYTFNGVRVDPGATPGQIAPGVTLANPTPANYDFNAQVQAALGKAPAPAIQRDTPPAAPPPSASAAGLPLPSGGWGGGGVGGTARLPATNVPTTDPRYIAQMEAAYDQQGKAYGGEQTANTQMAQFEALKHKSEEVGLMGEKAAIGKGKEDFERQTKERKQKSDEFLAKIDDYSAKLADEKVEQPSFMTKARWTIASMLGAVQQGFLHLQTNQIADRVHQEIQDDVERQKIEFERHKGRKEDLNSLYAKAYAATGDEVEATKLANGLGLEMAKKETQQLVASADSDIAKARGDVLNAAIDTKKAQLAGQEAESEMKTHKYTPATTVSTGPSQAALLKRVQEIRNKGAEHGQDVSPQEAYRQAYIESTGRDPYGKAGAGVPLSSYAKGGGGLPANTPDAQSLASIAKLPEKQQKDALDEYNKRKGANQALQFGNSIFDKYQNKATDPGAFSRVRDVDANTMALELKNQLGPGFASDKDFDTLKTYMPQPLDSAETLAHKRQQYQDFIARHGQTPILDAYGIAPKATPGNVDAGTAAAAGFKPVQ
jgi:hypothetical protein